MHSCTYKKFKENAAVGVEIGKGDGARLLKVHSIHQCGGAFVCVRGNVISLRLPYRTRNKKKDIYISNI